MTADLFADDNMTLAAIYQQGELPPVSIRLIRRELPVGSGGLGGLSVRSQGIEVEVLAEDFSAAPQEGARLALATDEQSAPSQECLVRKVLYDSQRRTYVLTLNRNLE